VLERDNFACRMCGIIRPTPDLVADHRKPHNGDASLFWDEANLQTLCAECHSSTKQAEEIKSGPRGMWY
jgi:5-methylcytosine-specific restriction endonuclease McrA